MLKRVLDQTGLEQLAAALAQGLQPGDSILLSGPLGVGKTTLARALIRAACADQNLEVPSPSYTLVQSYQQCRPALHHLDLWRLDSPGALAELGWEELRRDAVIVEWPDRLAGLRPPHALEINLQPAEPEKRALTLTGWPQARLSCLATRV